jgi:predicted AAA+ superfamily ATPase
MGPAEHKHTSSPWKCAVRWWISSRVVVDFQPRRGRFHCHDPRHITPRIADALGDTPVVYLQGARQTGKSTLAQAIAQQRGFDYLTLDAAAVFAAADADPEGLVAGLSRPTAVDEVLRVPGLALAIKAAVDRHRRPGQFLLTGSASVLALPKLSESLVGRFELHTLWPFSQGELIGRRESFVDRLFDAEFRPYLRGVVLYLGDVPVPFGDRLHALPVDCLWA